MKEKFYYAMTSDGPWMLSASDGEAAMREVFESYYLRRETKYIYSVRKEILEERPENGWSRDEFQMELGL